jgi:hypothetical protein
MSNPEPTMPDPIRFELQLKISGEPGCYKAEHLINAEIPIIGINVVEATTKNMLQALLKERGLHLYGECTNKECDRPRIPVPLSTRTDLCAPHDYEIYQLELRGPACAD